MTKSNNICEKQLPFPGAKNKIKKVKYDVPLRHDKWQPTYKHSLLYEGLGEEKKQRANNSLRREDWHPACPE